MSRMRFLGISTAPILATPERVQRGNFVHGFKIDVVDLMFQIKPEETSKRPSIWGNSRTQNISRNYLQFS
jgi:hypothetical protein